MDDFVVVPAESLSVEAIKNLIDEFIQREGTDYGHKYWDIQDKRRQVLKQITGGEARIVFDPTTESCTLLLQQTLKPKK